MLSSLSLTRALCLPASALSLRRDPRILKLPPYLSFLCILVGVVWLFLLPLNNYSRRTYISENALLPGQVHTYFGGSEQHVLRAYRHEVDEVVGRDNYQYVYCAGAQLTLNRADWGFAESTTSLRRF